MATGPGIPGWRKTDADDYRVYLAAHPFVRAAASGNLDATASGAVGCGGQ